MAGSGSFSISITAVDGASKVFEGLNKRIQGMTAPAQRFNKALSKFGDVSGLSRVTEGVRSLGQGAATAFRSLDRMASPLGAITGAASIAGMVELNRRWAEFGNQINNISYRLNTPVEKLGALHGAMRLAGGKVSDVDSGLRGLQDNLNGAFWKRDPRAIQFFKALGVATDDGHGHVRNAADAMRDLSDRIKGMPSVTQARILNESGLGEGFLPLVKNGSQELEQFERRAKATGGVMTGEMVKSATEVNSAWQELGETIEGVGNRLEEKYNPAVKKVLETTSHWIQHNKKLADSIAEIGIAIGGLVMIRPAAWVLRLLGLGGLMSGPVVATAAPLLLGGDTAPSYGTAPGGATFGSDGPVAQWWRRTMPTWLGGAPNVPSSGRHNPLNLRYHTGQIGASPTSSGFGAYSSDEAGVAAAEHQLMLYRQRGVTSLGGIISKWAPPNENDTAKYIADVSRKTGWGADQQVDVSDPRQAERLIAAMATHETHALPAGVIDRGVAMAGHVQVEVNLKGAPPGTTAHVATSGPVSAPPPRIETPMPMVH